MFTNQLGLLYVGWRNQRRIYDPVLHLDIMDNKIWIQQDGTELGIANELVELGVPKQDIILGFDTPNMRQLSDFAIDKLRLICENLAFLKASIFNT